MTLLEEFLDAVEEGERPGSSKVNIEITRKTEFSRMGEQCF